MRSRSAPSAGGSSIELTIDNKQPAGSIIPSVIYDSLSIKSSVNEFLNMPRIARKKSGEI